MPAAIVDLCPIICHKGFTSPYLSQTFAFWGGKLLSVAVRCDRQKRIWAFPRRRTQCRHTLDALRRSATLPARQSNTFGYHNEKLTKAIVDLTVRVKVSIRGSKARLLWWFVLLENQSDRGRDHLFAQLHKSHLPPGCCHLACRAESSAESVQEQTGSTKKKKKNQQSSDVKPDYNDGDESTHHLVLIGHYCTLCLSCYIFAPMSGVTTDTLLNAKEKRSWCLAQ